MQYSGNVAATVNAIGLQPSQVLLSTNMARFTAAVAVLALLAISVGSAQVMQPACYPHYLLLQSGSRQAFACACCVSRSNWETR